MYVYLQLADIFLPIYLGSTVYFVPPGALKVNIDQFYVHSCNVCVLYPGFFDE